MTKFLTLSSDGNLAEVDLSPATATPQVENGSGSVGTSAKYALEDHVHPAASGSSTGSTLALFAGCK